MGDRKMAIFGSVETAPKKQIPRVEFGENGVGDFVGRRGWGPGAALDDPFRHFIGLARDVVVAQALQEVINGSGAVHAALLGIMGVDEVSEIQLGQCQCRQEAFLNLRTLGGEAFKVAGLQSRDGCLRRRRLATDEVGGE